MTTQISDDDVKKVAINSRLNADPDHDFVQKYKKELNGVLVYVDEMSKADVSGINVLKRARKINKEDLREDIPDTDLVKKQRIRQNIINGFPSSQGDLLILPAIFKDR